jgi:hypothetical protein
MNNKNNLAERIEAIKNIYFSAKIPFIDSEYLYLPETEEEKKVANNNLFIHRIRISCWRNSVLEICKLFLDSDNEHFNLFKFIRSLKSEYKSISQEKNVSDAKIDSWISELNRGRVVEIVTRLKILRDKHIAHTDMNSKTEFGDVRVTFKETRELLNVTEKVLFEIISLYLHAHQIFDVAGTEKAGRILQIIHEHNEWFIERLRTNNT